MKQQITKETEALLRKQRIEILGAFGMKQEKKVPDKTKYTRKAKHPKPVK